MKISELVKELQAILEKNGDLLVHVYEYEYEMFDSPECELVIVPAARRSDAIAVKHGTYLLLH